MGLRALTGDGWGTTPEQDQLAGGLAEHAPVLPFSAEIAEIVDVCLAEDGHDWLVLVDREAKPVRLVERAALLRGEPFEHHVSVLSADASPAACARQASGRSRVDRLRPLACCDAGGRFLGLIRVERLLAALAAGS